jgi:predicted nucleic acid-binding protein
MPSANALRDVRQILASPSLLLLGETARPAEIMAAVVETSGATGNLVHDAHIAALCLEHGVSGLVTGDRDFAHFLSFAPSIRSPHPEGGRGMEATELHQRVRGR